MINVNVPGKVMLSGEYAVLYRASAVLFPVDRYLRLSEDSRLLKTEYPKMVAAARQHPIAKLAAFEEKHGLPAINIDNREFYADNKNGKAVKLGLGSSAAETVGTLFLRYQRAGFDYAIYRDEICREAEATSRE